MRLIKGLQRRPWMALALVIACVAVGSIAFWRASKLPAEASLEGKQRLQERMRLQERLHKGVGSEVRFATASAKPEQIAEAVRSTADFIYWRSGLKMSDATERQLVEAETNVLKGKSQHITLGELTARLTETVVERLANLRDDEIGQAAQVSSDEHGQILSRANGKWGALTQREFIQQAKSGRDWSQRGDSTLRVALRSMIEEEVNDRVVTLGTALPEQFGRATVQGFTPTQALLIVYSVAADDPLTDSRSDIEQALVQKRMEAGQTREQRRAQRHISGRPYGPHGLLHPSAPYLVFNKAGIDRLLNLSEGGKN
jgi:hypothetical protein